MSTDEAFRDLIACLKDGTFISETSLEALIEAEPDDGERKRLIIGLKCAELIDDDTTAWAIAYRWPLKEA